MTYTASIGSTLSMQIHIDQHPGDLEPDDITEIISALMSYIEEHFFHEECTDQIIRLDLAIKKLVWMLPTEPKMSWLDEWRESWERNR